MNHRTLRLVFYFKQRMVFKLVIIMLKKYLNLNFIAKFVLLYGSGKITYFTCTYFQIFEEEVLNRSCALSFTLIASQMQQHYLILVKIHNNNNNKIINMVVIVDIYIYITVKKI